MWSGKKKYNPKTKTTPRLCRKCRRGCGWGVLEGLRGSAPLARWGRMLPGCGRSASLWDYNSASQFCILCFSSTSVAGPSSSLPLVPVTFVAAGSKVTFSGVRTAPVRERLPEPFTGDPPAAPGKGNSRLRCHTALGVSRAPKPLNRWGPRAARREEGSGSRRAPPDPEPPGTGGPRGLDRAGGSPPCLPSPRRRGGSPVPAAGLGGGLVPVMASAGFGGPGARGGGSGLPAPLLKHWQGGGG